MPTDLSTYRATAASFGRLYARSDFVNADFLYPHVESALGRGFLAGYIASAFGVDLSAFV